MKRWLITLALLGGWAGWGAHTASAQPGYNPPQTNPNPTLSPYLNLIPNNPYIQYFGLAQGQVGNTRALQQLQMQALTNQAGYYPLGVSNPGVQPTITTGHAVTFQNLSHYYPPAGAPFAGMGATNGGVGGYGGIGGIPSVNTQLPQGYAQYYPR
jgi:hypothetical protein